MQTPHTVKQDVSKDGHGTVRAHLRPAEAFEQLMRTLASTPQARVVSFHPHAIYLDVPGHNERRESYSGSPHLMKALFFAATWHVWGARAGYGTPERKAAEEILENWYGLTPPADYIQLLELDRATCDHLELARLIIPLTFGVEPPNASFERMLAEGVRALEEVDVFSDAPGELLVSV